MHQFGQVDGTAVDEITISNGDLTAKVLTWGAVVRDLRLRDHGPALVLGFDSFDHYLAHSPHFGAIAGRYANRIRDGRFSLDGQQHQLTLNQNAKHHLHGGISGFGTRPWQVTDQQANSVTLALTSPDGDQGYPGTLNARCTYSIESPAVLAVSLTASCDAATVVNLAHHSYFTLDGGASITDHRLHIPADRYTPVDNDLLPTGEIASVAATPFDFRSSQPVGRRVGGQLFHYDINYVCANSPRAVPALMAALVGPERGLRMEVWSTEPGLQIYDGSKLAVPVPGLDGQTYAASAGMCFEPQRFPDSPNNPQFKDCVLRPGQTYTQNTQYRFSSK